MPEYQKFIRFLSFSLVILLSACASRPKERGTDARASRMIELRMKDPITEGHIRGLHVLDDSVAWASGSGGTVLRMIDGLHWQKFKVHGFEDRDFRDVQGFSADEAIIMAVDSPGVLLRTADGGITWNQVYRNDESGIFLDGLAFDGQQGYCIGDPVDGNVFVLSRADQGSDWIRIDLQDKATANPGEGSFAASGTTIVAFNGSLFLAFNNDSVSRILFRHPFTSFDEAAVPMRRGSACGVFSMAFKDEMTGVAVGGCYLDSSSTVGNCAITMNGARHWESIYEKPPRGYRSCVVYVPDIEAYVACGRTGIDISYDDGSTWDALSSEGFFTCAAHGRRVWFMGRHGKNAYMDL